MDKESDTLPDGRVKSKATRPAKANALVSVEKNAFRTEGGGVDWRCDIGNCTKSYSKRESLESHKRYKTSKHDS